MADLEEIAWRVVACGVLASCGAVPQSVPEIVAPVSASEPVTAFAVAARVEAPPAIPVAPLTVLAIPPPIGLTRSIEPTELIEPTGPAELGEESLDPDRPAEPIALATSAIEVDRAPTSIVHHLGAAEVPRRYGMMFDVGVPDGATLAIAMRPVRAIRIDAGISYNGVSHGVRAGITLVPFATWFTPTLSLDAGHYSEGDANPLVRLVTGDPMYSSPALARVGYDYGDAQLGLELGRKRFTFFLRAGVTRVMGNLHDLGAVVGDMPKSPVTFGSDPALTVTALSARMGFVLYFGGSR